MKTYYITIDTQGQTEIIVEVEAKNAEEAKGKAALAYLADKEFDAIDCELATELQEDGIMLIDENGEELA